MNEPAVFKIYNYDECFYVEYSVDYEKYTYLAGDKIIKVDGEIGGSPCEDVDQVLELIKAHLLRGLAVCKNIEK